ncbi:hypothetical protein R6Q57_023252 [Mikania cordata]
MDPETLALSQHEWLQFEPASAAAMRCRRIIRMSMGMPRCIDWGVLGDCGEAERSLLTVEFLSTFRYRAHQAAVRVEEDAELPPDIEFSLNGQHFEMSIERFAVHLGIYYEPETAGRATWHGVSYCTTPPSTTDRSAVHCGVAPLSPTLPGPEAWLTSLMICRRSSLVSSIGGQSSA